MENADTMETIEEAPVLRNPISEMKNFLQVHGQAKRQKKDERT